VRLDHVAPEQVIGHVVDTRREVGEPDVAVTVGLGLLTKRSRFETFVEKAVELGVRRIVPLRTRHAEPSGVRADRLRRVMVAALKQCRRSRLPDLTAPRALDALLGATTADVRLLCHGGDAHPPIFGALEEAGGDDVLALVGPEGGFAPDEVAAATEAGCTPVSLGPRRLRAETAGLVAVNAVMLRAAPRAAE
jgi:16S rRNA (uracil1498-N3)-methyltransferase